MTQEMNYKKAFEWVCEQIDKELEWAKKDPRAIHEVYAYESIKHLCDNIKRYGVDEYENKCKEVYEKYRKYAE